MTRSAEVLLTVVGSSLIGAGAWYWWNQHSGEFLNAGKAANAEGKKSGAGQKEGACLAEALARHKAGANGSFGTAVRNSVWLSSCLDASTPHEKFCVGVPGHTEIVAGSIWITQMCALHGLSDSYCTNLFQNIPKYCSSLGRVEKLNRSVTPNRAREMRQQGRSFTLQSTRRTRGVDASGEKSALESGQCFFAMPQRGQLTAGTVGV